MEMGDRVDTVQEQHGVSCVHRHRCDPCSKARVPSFSWSIKCIFYPTFKLENIQSLMRTVHILCT